MSFVKSIAVSEESVLAVMQRYPDQGLADSGYGIVAELMKR